MSRINFEPLRAEFPQLVAVWNGLEEWIVQHPDEEFLDPSRLSVELRPLPPVAIINGLLTLVSRGDVQPRYKVRTPAGVLLGGEYETPEQIPKTLSDRLERHWFSVEKSNILPVFRVPAATSH